MSKRRISRLRRSSISAQTAESGGIHQCGSSILGDLIKMNKKSKIKIKLGKYQNTVVWKWSGLNP